MMILSLPLIALLLLAGSTAGLPALGQTVYKCGSVYSQQPCPGAVTIDASDSRTPAQKAQTDTAVAQATKAAAKMEQERLALEKAQNPKPPKKAVQASQSAKTDSSGKTPGTRAKQKRKEPEYFTAAVATGKKEKKTDKKSGDPAQAATADKPAKP